MATITDSATGRTTTYYYDFIDRMMRYVENGSNYHHAVGYEYDKINNLTKLVETINGASFTTDYTYDADNRVTKVEAGGVDKNYTYDTFGRVSQQQTKQGDTAVKTDTFQFTAPAIAEGDTDTTPRTSSQVASHSIVTNANDPTKYNKTFTYTYDDNGNIESISDGERTVFYTYDSANQLIGEYNGFTETVTVWGYDSAGNITNWRKLEYINGSLGSVLGNGSYTYKTGENDWRDLLIKYNNEDINYDDIGNPLTWGNRTYTWKHGRQLATLSENGTAWTFTYNADGIRTKRTNGSTTYNYVYNGDKLSQMTKGNDTLNFFYDASGTPMSVQYNGTTYYYVTNIQGDVIAILNGSGAAEVEYLYNAWGELHSITFSENATQDIQDLGTYNPLRYRGYVYDQEYELYYLQSRYYDPSLGRFLNIDVYASTGQGILGGNPFVYALNDPINYVDPSGELAYPGQIHNEVVRRIAEKYRFKREQRIQYSSGGWGRADLVSRNGRVWDVKPNKSRHIKAGRNQVKKYAKGTWLNSPKKKLKIGNNIIPKTKFDYKCGAITYTVQYWSVEGGVIVYDYWIKEIDTKKVANTVLVVGSAVVLGVASAYIGVPLVKFF